MAKILKLFTFIVISILLSQCEKNSNEEKTKQISNEISVLNCNDSIKLLIFYERIKRIELDTNYFVKVFDSRITPHLIITGFYSNSKILNKAVLTFFLKVYLYQQKNIQTFFLRNFLCRMGTYDYGHIDLFYLIFIEMSRYDPHQYITPADVYKWILNQPIYLKDKNLSQLIDSINTIKQLKESQTVFNNQLNKNFYSDSVSMDYKNSLKQAIKLAKNGDSINLILLKEIIPKTYPEFFVYFDNYLNNNVVLLEFQIENNIKNGNLDFETYLYLSKFMSEEIYNHFKEILDNEEVLIYDFFRNNYYAFLIELLCQDRSKLNIFFETYNSLDSASKKELEFLYNEFSNIK